MTPADPKPPSDEAFPSIARRDIKRLVALATRYLGCEHLAHDALQEALMSLSKQEEAPTHPDRWLTRAVIHRCRHLRRSRTRREHHEQMASEHCELHGDCTNPLHVAIAHEIGETLEASRNALPPDQRVALDLFEAEGQDYSTISTTLGVPIGTVRSRLSRARDALRTALSRLGD